MRTVTMHLKSVSPLSFGGMYKSTKNASESHDDFDTRCWRERVSVNERGEPVIQGVAIQRAIQTAAKRFPVKKKGAATFTKNFESGIMPTADLRLGVELKDFVGVRIMMNADGKRGGGSRVPRTIPHLSQWSGTIDFVILDDEIREKDFEETVRKAGFFVGVGQYRPENLGQNGRFEVERFEWQAEAAKPKRSAA